MNFFSTDYLKITKIYYKNPPCHPCTFILHFPSSDAPMIHDSTHTFKAKSRQCREREMQDGQETRDEKKWARIVVYIWTISITQATDVSTFWRHLRSCQPVKKKMNAKVYIKNTMSSGNERRTNNKCNARSMISPAASPVTGIYNEHETRHGYIPNQGHHRHHQQRKRLLLLQHWRPGEHKSSSNPRGCPHPVG